MSTSVSDRENGAAALKLTPLQRAFDLWSQVYDDQLNPLISLEQRFLSRMLPDIRGFDVLDAGCGTGRWLEYLADQSPRSLVGIDASPEMLARVLTKSIQNVDIHLGDCSALPVQNCSIDLTLASFVLSYIDNLEKFAEELARITRSGKNVVLTDMHPETALFCGWKRSFHANGVKVEIEVPLRSLEQIVSVFYALGFEMVSLLEPCFGTPEHHIFKRGDKFEVLNSSSGLPAIYLLQLQKTSTSKPRRIPLSTDAVSTHIQGARFALGTDEAIHATITVEEGRIRQIFSHRPGQLQSTSLGNNIDLSGYLILPGLINAHDHLEFGLFPNLGHGHYENSAVWADDIHHTDACTIELHRSVPKDVRIWWGIIRNLISGVTTVCHHDPLTPEILNTHFPVRLLTRFGWAHSFALDTDISGKFQATPPDMPFIMHLGEGLDRQSENEIFDLDRMGALDERTILVHGLALSHDGISLLNRRGAALIICPTSNGFLFGRIHPHELLASIVNLALASDSPLTASGDLLDEVRFAHSVIALDSNNLYEMVTARPAKMLRLQDGEGHLKPGVVADLIAVRDDGSTPAETLVGLSSADIELVVLSGRVQLASASILERLPEALRHDLQPLEVSGHIRWIRAPVDRLFSQTEKVLGNVIRIGGKRVRYVGAS